jgi:two-component system, sensor histidine kinase and response regulator
VTSAPGAGSSFWFTLPMHVDRDAPTPTREPEALRGVRALVVDDNDVNRAVLADQLGRAGMTIALADGGLAALDLLRQAAASGTPYAIAFLDLHMPGMDGMALGHLVATDPAISQTRLVMLSSAAEAGGSGRFAEAGFAAHLTKPVRPQTLLEIAATVLDSRRSGPQPIATRHTLTAPATGAHSGRRRSDVVSAPAQGRALIVEDNRINQMIAVGMLEKLGWRVDVAGNGREGVEMWERMPYAIVLMDCQMPEMDGYEATREIRRLEAIRDSRVTIIALTAGAMEEDRQRCLGAGMDDFLTKPLQARDLAATLDRWVSATAT